ncbi:MAG: winged helix-turn-helix transcriptional regulator [Clostridia bacterium]|nr:winged helix-turn-helix transcriptional regulator [Clostridia bacterium]
MKRLEIKSADAILKSALQSWWEEFSPCAPAEYSLVIVDLDSACASNDKEALTVSYTLPCDLPRPFCFEELEQKCKASPAWTMPECDEQSFVYEEDASREAPKGQPQLQGKARLVFEGGQVFLDGNALALSALEYRMLEILYNQEAPISAKDLSLALWGKERASNQINVYINYLRKKTDMPHRERLIFTERQKGFYIKQ